MKAKEEVRQGSGNVFADLELPDAEATFSVGRDSWDIIEVKSSTEVPA